jgi:hypothetical protein
MATITLGNGTVLRVQRPDKGEIWRLWDALQKADEAAVKQAVLAFIPDATEDDARWLAEHPEDAIAIGRVAAGGDPTPPMVN